MNDSKTCIVTGGAGFIGSHLCDSLLAKGYKVVAVDNLLTGREDNISAARRHDTFSFIHHDVINPLTYNGKVEYIFHLASPASVVDYQRYPLETALVNARGTQQLLDFAKEKQAKFLFTSTSEVYGDPKEHPQKETYWGNVNPTGVRACYDESKRFGEMMTLLYKRLFGVDVKVIRIFNTYGPRMKKDDGRVVSNFINQALVGKPLTVYGQGTQTRSFCYVSDMVEGLMKAMFSDNTNGEVINLGNPQEFTILDLANKIKSLTNSSSQIVYENLPKDDPTQRKPDISKAKDLLDWEPKVSVDSGLQKTIEYYQHENIDI